MPQTFIKDPDAVLDYKFDFAGLTNGASDADSDWLESGETISSHTVTVSAGLTKDSDSATDTDTSVTVWLSGGTAGSDYECTCQVVTSNGRTDDRTISIQVRDR